MKIYATTRNGITFEYWYDRSYRCWWAREIDSEQNQVGDAQHAYTKHEILYAIETW